MNGAYYVGSYKNDALHGPNNGWIAGSFIAEPPRKNDAVEIKYWEFKAGSVTGHPVKVSSIIEVTLVIKGKVRSMIDGQELILKAGDYVIIKPGVENNLQVEILDDTEALTVKAPSDPKAKKVVRDA
jgi:quercetin dioxygenase-like cupin family protein